MSMTPYPLEVAVFRRPTKTIALDASFQLAKAENNECPLMVYGGGSLSRIIVHNIEKGGSSFDVNIPVTDLADLFQATDFADAKHREALCSGTQAESATSPAYTVAIRSGNLKGRTPADVLLESGQQGLDQLRSQYKFLQENVAKYPANQQQMDAIAEAGRLFQNGELKPVKGTGGTIPLYMPGMKALDRAVRADGFCKVNVLEITWTLTSESPVTISAQTFYAPFEKSADGRVKAYPARKDPQSVKKMELSVSAKEWNNAMRAIKTAMRMFETANCRILLDDAMNADRINRQQRQEMTR